MANAVRVRVELRENRHADHDERDSAFKRMFTAFKKQCSEAGVMHAYKQHETFESRSRKRRRKKRESEVQRLKAKLKENFTPPGKRTPHE
jgi:ribosomal protein S21